MRIDIRAFSVASGATGALLSALCRLAFIVAPGAATDVASALVHTDYTALAQVPTVASFVGGVVGWGVIAALLGATLAWWYNRIADRSAATA